MSKLNDEFRKAVKRSAQGETDVDMVFEGNLIAGYGKGIMDSGVQDLIFGDDADKAKQTIWIGMTQVAIGLELIAQQYGVSIYDVIKIANERLADDEPKSEEPQN